MAVEINKGPNVVVEQIPGPVRVLSQNSNVPGPPGKSAYQVAVDNGFVGTEADWLASLKGDPGTGGGTGTGLPLGGTTGQTIVKDSATDGDASWKTLTAADVGALPDTYSPDLSAYATNTALTSGLAGKANTSDIPVAASTTPSPLGAAAAGVGTAYARADHVHKMPTSADVGAVPTTRTVNAKALSTNITLTAADVGARPDTWTPDLSGYATTTALTNGLATKADTSYVDSGDASTLASANAYTDASVAASTSGVSRVNGYTGDVTLTAADVGALPDTYSPDLSAYATTTDLTNGLAGKADTTALNSYVLTTDLNTTLSGYATNTALTNGLAGKANTTDIPTANTLSGATTVGKSVMTAADAAAARTAIGAGTSNLALGTTASTAKAGDWKPAWATDITGLPATFAPTIGTTATTAMAGNKTATDLGGVPSTRMVNGKALSADVTLAAADVSAVPTTRTVNAKALSANITLTAADVSAVPTTRTVNAKPLSADVTLGAADVGAVPTTRTVNAKPLSADISLTATDVGAATTAQGAKADTAVQPGAALSGFSGQMTATQLMAGTTLSVTYSGTAWPARPTSRTDIKVLWFCLTKDDPTPTGFVAGDYLVRPAV